MTAECATVTALSSALVESPPREPDPPAVEREDLRSRSPSPELESADLPDDDPLAA